MAQLAPQSRDFLRQARERGERHKVKSTAIQRKKGCISDYERAVQTAERHHTSSERHHSPSAPRS